MEKSIVKLEKLRKVFSYPEIAKEMRVRSDVDLAKGDSFLATVAGLIKEVKATFKPIKDKQREALNETLAQERRHLAPLEESRNIAKPKLAKYLEAKEKDRLAKEAELRKAQEEADAAADAAVQKAVEADERGDTEEADRIVEDEIISPPAPTVRVPEKKKPEHSYLTRIPMWEIVDESKLKREHLMPDRAKIGKLVKGMGLDAQLILGDGVRVWIKTDVATRSK